MWLPNRSDGGALRSSCPEIRWDEVEKIIGFKSPKGKLVFVGDGINDAPVLARADIGIAMGGLGSDAAIEAADVVIMTDEPSKIATAMKISRKTLGIVKQNIVFALGVRSGIDFSRCRNRQYVAGRICRCGSGGPCYPECNACPAGKGD